MDRRNFLKCSSVAAFAGTMTASAARAAKAADEAATVSAPATVSRRRRLRMVSIWADQVNGPGDHIRRFAKRVEAATDGRWMIEVDDGAALGAQAFTAVMSGEADLYAGHEHAHRELHPAFSYFAGLPCRTGMRADRFNAWLMAAGGMDLWDDLAGEFNMKGLMIGHSGRSHGLLTQQALHNLADFHGKRIATMGLGADVLKAVDASPANGLSYSPVSLLADATLDGCEVIGADLELGQHLTAQSSASTKFAVNPPINDSGYSISIGLRRSFWDGLSNSEQITLAALATEATSASRADSFAHARVARQLNGSLVQQRRNRRPYDAPGSQIAKELRHIADAIVADISGHDDLTRRINASYMAFKGPVRSLSMA
ncbi:MAG: hypothetical protein KDJ45_02320 [Hyphomicrobiaceae bacterium]|nr:hypothetical protein [Hyphomicrobiaceae bacterium]